MFVHFKDRSIFAMKTLSSISMHFKSILFMFISFYFVLLSSKQQLPLDNVFHLVSSKFSFQINIFKFLASQFFFQWHFKTSLTLCTFWDASIIFVYYCFTLIKITEKNYKNYPQCQSAVLLYNTTNYHISINMCKYHYLSSVCVLLKQSTGYVCLCLCVSVCACTWVVFSWTFKIWSLRYPEIISLGKINC